MSYKILTKILTDLNKICKILVLFSCWDEYADDKS